MDKMFVLGVVLMSCLVDFVHGHSWLVCADYGAELSNDEQDFDFANCKAYPRGYFDSNNVDEFANGGVYTKSSVTSSFAITDPLTDGYDETYTYATYTPGSTYRLVWPAKNHAIGAECGETSSTDKGMAIYVNLEEVNPTSDLTSLDDYTLVYDWHAESGEFEDSSNKAVEGVPFANCMDYCSDTDASPCWGDITIPTDLFTESGFYTFLWYWDFSVTLNTVFEVYVNVDGDVVEVVAGDSSDTSNNGDDSEEEEEASYYQILAPMCYSGAQYDESTIIDTLETLFAPIGAEFEMYTYSETSSQDGFNFTVETYTYDVVTIAPTINNGTVCDRLVDAFGSGSCAVCNGGTKLTVYNANSSSSGSSEDYGVKLALGLIVAALVIFGLLGYYFYRTKISPDPHPRATSFPPKPAHIPDHSNQFGSGTTDGRSTVV